MASFNLDALAGQLQGRLTGKGAVRRGTMSLGAASLDAVIVDLDGASDATAAADAERVYYFNDASAAAQFFVRGYLFPASDRIDKTGTFPDGELKVVDVFLSDLAAQIRTSKQG